MKKISSLIVCLAILAIGTAFALELPDALKIPGLTVTGDVRTGLQVTGETYDKFGDHFATAGEAGAVDPTVKAYSDDIGDDVTPFRAQLQLVWERDNLGVKTRFRYRPDDANGDLHNKLSDLNNTVNKAFVYANLFDKKVKVSVGKGTDEAWGISGTNYGSGPTTGFDGKDGVKVEVKPIAGLNAGVFYGTGNLFNNARRDGTFSDQKETDRRLVTGAKYSNDLFRVVATTAHNFVEFDRNPADLDADGNQFNNYGIKPFLTDTSGGSPVTITNYGYDGTKNIDAPLPNTSNLFLQVGVTPIEPLSIDFYLLAVNLGAKKVTAFYGGEEVPSLYKKGDFNPFTFWYPKLNAEYAINDSLSVGIWFTDMKIADSYYYAESDPTKAADEIGAGGLFPITINPYASYAINDDITASVDLNFKINEGGGSQFGFGFKPGIEFSLGSGATFVVWDEITFYGVGNDDAEWIAKHQAANNANAHGGASGTTNSLQFDFVWTF